MKSRPRRAENGIARELNHVFVPLGFSEIKRIPVLGREGPDLTINETGLVVDVKSRKQCPKTYFTADEEVLISEGNPNLAAAAVKNLPKLDGLKERRIFDSVMVRRWVDHMDDWRRGECPQGISIIVLHRPRLPYGSSMVVFYLSDIGKTMELFDKKEQI
jgi:hypothetical protein